jgi:hypothetical protein
LYAMLECQATGKLLPNLNCLLIMKTPLLPTNHGQNGYLG